MASVLTLQGLLQGTMLEMGADFVNSMVAMKPYWFTRTIAGVTMDIGAILGMWNFYMTVMQGRRFEAPVGAVPEPQWT
jgi:cytochrome c oxidase cbb3-type subunit 1